MMAFCLPERGQFSKYSKIITLIAVLSFLAFIMKRLSLPDEAFFVPVLTAAEKEEMMNMASLFAQILERRNITYFMFGGTLLGSFRHHDVIPWDDDLDFMVNSSQKWEIVEEVNKIKPDFDLFMPCTDLKDPRMWKFYSTTGTKVTMGSFKWPFVDLFFFEENMTHIWNPEPYYLSQGEVYPKSKIFPLVRRPLGQLELYSPCDPVYMLNHDYDTSICVSREYDHRSGMRLFQFSQTRIPCEKLSSFSPLVNRTMYGDVIMETLRVGSSLKKSRQFKKNQCLNSRSMSYF